jgi:hypothetical protein
MLCLFSYAMLYWGYVRLYASIDVIYLYASMFMLCYVYVIYLYDSMFMLCLCYILI